MLISEERARYQSTKERALVCKNLFILWISLNIILWARFPGKEGK
jgi:hypothetical protein